MAQPGIEACSRKNARELGKMNSSNGNGLGGLSLHMSTDLAPSTGDRLGGGLSSEMKVDLKAVPGLSKAFLKGASHNVRALSKALRELCQKQDAVGRQETVLEIQRQMVELKGMFSSGKMEILTTFVSCLNRLIGSLKDNPKPPNPSVLRTITNALDFLRQLVDAGCDCRETENNPLRLMVVDDDAVCRRAMTLALSSGDLKLEVCENGIKALEILREQPFDVIFLDIMMPGVNGLVLARTIRELAANRETPIVFVTCLSDFKTRSESILSGGCDLMAKPIQPTEVVVKAYTLALRKRLSDGELTSAPSGNTTTATSTAPVPPTCIGMLHLNQEGVIETFDQDCARLLGFTPAEARGQQFEAIFAYELQQDPTLIERFLSSSSGKPFTVTLSARRKDGSITSLEATISTALGNPSRMVSLREPGLQKPAPAESEDALPVATSASARTAPQNFDSLSQPSPTVGVRTPPPKKPEPAPSDPKDLALRVLSLEQQLRTASEALAASQAALKKEKTCRAEFEARVNTPASQAQSLLSAQEALTAAQQLLETERQKREDLERKVEFLLAAANSSSNAATPKAPPSIDPPPAVTAEEATNSTSSPADGTFANKCAQGLKRLWSR